VANSSCPAANSLINTDKSIETLAAAQTAVSAERALQSFLDQYRGMTAVVPPFTRAAPGDVFFFDPLTDDDLPGLIAYGKLFICEWAKYSQVWVDRSVVTKVKLVKNLANPTRGSCKYSGLADWDGRALYQDVVCGAGFGPVWQKHTLHHEFWHLIAPSVHGHNPEYADSAWLALNDPGFSYGNSGWNDVTGWSIRFTPHPRPGFVSQYAMQHEREDEAETYAFMFVKEEFGQLAHWMTTDAILKTKVAYLKQFIASVDPAMNDSYLERAGH
jgi:hypothetical protein